ncbi:SDR family NAD(P)-dependent oxidoreductase [Microbacterium testaceum]|uniref:SDR family NAD(P)-dependent oxidoreductase n=1 Tax=Microbacterium testaceum TaxID=2033 RepID=UPI0034421687
MNVRSLTALTALLLPRMLSRKRGAVINVASTAGFQPVPHMAVYSASKAYVLTFTRALWSETRGTGVDVLALCPGATDTAFFATAGDAASVGNRRTPEKVVDSALRGLRRGRPSVVDGRANALVAWLAPRLPERLALGIAERSVRPR